VARQRAILPDAKLEDSTLRLRSERSGPGDGRVYLIVVSVLDTDNATGDSHVHLCVFTVVVPHDLSASSIASVEARPTRLMISSSRTARPPPGYFLVGDGPVIGPKQ
jgi:hypothetical protein